MNKIKSWWNSLSLTTRVNISSIMSAVIVMALMPIVCLSGYFLWPIVAAIAVAGFVFALTYILYSAFAEFYTSLMDK